MATKHPLLSATRINRLKAQGYCNYSDDELSELAFGNKFAYMVCFAILAIGVATANIPTLIAMTIVAFFGIVLPYPFLQPLDFHLKPCYLLLQLHYLFDHDLLFVP